MRAFPIIGVVAAMCAMAAVAQGNSPLLRNNGIGGRPRPGMSNASNAKAEKNLAAKASASAAEKADGENKLESDLNFIDAPVEMVFEIYSKLVDRTVLKDPSTPSANITIQSRPGQKLTKEEQIEAIEVVLEMNGVHMENYGEKFVRALPREKARQEGIPLILDEEAQLADSGKVVSMMFNFKNIPTDEAEKILSGLKSQKGSLLVYERKGSILVTDTMQNIRCMREIVNEIDIATPVNENVFVRQIRHAAAEDIKAALQQIVEESQKELDKAGNAAKTAQQQMNNFPPFMRNRLLARNNQQQQAPQPNEANKSVASQVANVSDADRGMIRGKVLILSDERSNKLIIVTAKTNMDFFDKVIEQLDVETTPDVQVKVYRLKYADAEDVSDMINDLIGNASGSKSNSKQNQNQNANKGTSGNVTSGRAQGPARQTSPKSSNESRAGELSKENVTVLADKRINGLVVMARKEDIPTLEQIIESMDVKLSQVLIETVIIEVQLGDDLKTGVDWVLRGRDRKSGKLVRDGLANNGSFGLGGGGGSGSGSLQQMVGVASNVVNNAYFGGATPIGSGVNYLLKSDKLNLAAVIQASKSDNRSKYIASPIVMTVDNKEATIEATETRKFFNGYESSSSSYTYIRTPKYDSKDIGIKIKVTPKINPNGTVMLEVEEEYSQLGAGQSILVEGSGVTDTTQVDTSVTRKMSADVLLDDGQTVVLGGLTETKKTDKESGVPILKDIPWVGKWLFGTVEQQETRNELLVFMTPHVIDDGDMAQAEALRRKKSLSDARPWDDHGWSKSPLADPVSKKEQLRKLKDDWKAQDEERKTRLAIEKAKIDRIRDIDEMSKDEEDFWLEIYKRDLDDASRKKLEREMEERINQEHLRELAAQIKSRKLKEASAKIKEDEEVQKNSEAKEPASEAVDAEPQTMLERE